MKLVVVVVESVLAVMVVMANGGFKKKNKMVKRGKGEREREERGKIERRV